MTTMMRRPKTQASQSEPHCTVTVSDVPINSSHGRSDGPQKRKAFRNKISGRVIISLFLLLSSCTLSYYLMSTRRLEEFSLLTEDSQQQQQRDLIEVAGVPPLVIYSPDKQVVQLQECSIPHHPITVQDGVGSQQPVLLSGWKIPAWMASSDIFIRNHGTAPFYIKDNAVQIKSADCVLSFQSLWTHITSSTEAESTPLAFTNDQENAAWFQKLPSLDSPTALQHISGFSVFSVLRKGQSHSFHKHGESWIAAAAGYKVWWFLPPDKPVPRKVNACHYLTGKEELPPGTTTCVQLPGTIIWFPKDWYHATCALSDWTVGIGKQQGPLI